MTSFLSNFRFIIDFSGGCRILMNDLKKYIIHVIHLSVVMLWFHQLSLRLIFVMGMLYVVYPYMVSCFHLTYEI